jgi:putative ABC transport system permease protein
MLTNYIKIAWRSLRKHKLFSFINILGLAVGLSAFWLIMLYVANELSYDRFNDKADRIFRVVHHGSWKSGKFDIVPTSVPLAAELKKNYPEVQATVRFNQEGGGRLKYSDKQFKVDDIFFTDNSVFDVFSFHFLSGDPKTALSNPRSIVLTKSLAEKLFGNAEAALNKTVLFQGNYPNLVSGVIDDIPANSHISFSALRSFDTGFTDRWPSFYVYTYLLLYNPADSKKIEGASADIYNKYLKSELGEGLKYQMELQPLTAIHLQSHLEYELGNNGSMMYVYIFGAVALLILFIAVINYVNLTTARSSARVKEVGVRKVIGSGRKQLMLMFFTESVLLTFIATVIAGVLLKMVLPYFNQLTGKSLVLWQFGMGYTIAAMVVFSIITGLLSGIYPALFLSGFRVIPAMKGQTGNQASTVFFRKSLVTFQFVVTIVMIAGSVIIYQQLHYVVNKDMGFNKDQVLTFHIDDQNVRAKVPQLKQQLLQNPNIESAGIAGNPLGNNSIGTGDFNLAPDGSSGPASKLVQELIIDEDFIPTMQIKMLDGRDFQKEMPTDKTNAVIINETLARELGARHVIGRSVRTGVDDQGHVVNSTIIGIVKDFNSYSLQHKIAPMVFRMPGETNDQDNVYVRVSKSNIPATLKYIEKVYASFDNSNPLEYHFLDQNFARQYQAEQRQGSLILVFTILAICIACLGLFGLVTFSAEQRTKEIGIRKVLGASISNIVGLISKDFVLLLGVAFVIAAPLAWYAMSKWLQDFAYRISIQWWVFALSGGIALFIAFVTIGFRSVRAALANPVKSLRSE